MFHVVFFIHVTCGTCIGIFALHMHEDTALCWVCVHDYDHSSFLVNGCKT